MNAPLAPLRASVGESLRFFGYCFTTDPEQVDYRFHCHIPTGSVFPAQILLSPPTSVLRLVVHVTQPYPATRKPWLAEMAHRWNDKFAALGAIIYDMDRGSASYLTSVDLDGREATPDDVTRLLDASSFPLQAWDCAFSFVASEKVTPRQAVDAALLLQRVGTFADDPKDGMKALLKVEDGAASGGERGEPVNLFLI